MHQLGMIMGVRGSDFGMLEADRGMWRGQRERMEEGPAGGCS